MRKRSITGIAGCGLVGLALMLAAPSDNVLARSNDVLRAPLVASGCSGYCVVCLYDPGHAAAVAPPECDEEICQNMNANEGGGWHSSCVGANNCDNHTCQETSPSPEEVALSAADLLREVNEAVQRSDGVALRTLLYRNPKRAHFAAGRSAVQITACDGDVIAHYPVSGHLVGMLGE